MEAEAAVKGYRREEVKESRLQLWVFLLQPVIRAGLPLTYPSIVAKLREIGWEEDIDVLPQDLFPLSDHPQVRVVREISERSTYENDISRISLIYSVSLGKDP